MPGSCILHACSSRATLPASNAQHCPCWWRGLGHEFLMFFMQTCPDLSFGHENWVGTKQAPIHSSHWSLYSIFTLLPAPPPAPSIPGYLQSSHCQLQPCGTVDMRSTKATLCTVGIQMWEAVQQADLDGRCPISALSFSPTTNPQNPWPGPILKFPLRKPALTHMPIP